MSSEIRCFKAYDIRGRVPDELNEDVAYRIGRAYAEFIRPRAVVVGRDCRLSGRSLATALMSGLNDAGVDVLDIGLCGTEQIYFATSHLHAGGGIMVTASHNPADYNGMKLVREESRPISGDSGLLEIRRLAEGMSAARPTAHRGVIHSADVMDAYVSHLLGYVAGDQMRSLKLVVNAGNGTAGLVIDELERKLPHRFVKLQHSSDGTFPNGVPNPLLPANRKATSDAVLASGADMGIAWDGDFDRCFFFDERGEFIEGYYIVGLLAQVMLARSPGARIVHDPRLIWNTQEIVSRCGGIPVMTKTGHAFIKERMRQEDALYGGEMSAHHYFRDFAYCDSGMIPWLLVARILAGTGQRLSGLVRERMEKFPVSGEINREVADAERVLQEVRREYEPAALHIDETDGLSFEFSEWRFNLRLSNTEPVIRLNVETRANRQLLGVKTREVLELIERARPRS